MRNNRKGLPEIIDAVERDGQYFGVAQVVLSEQPHAFEFGLDAQVFTVPAAPGSFRSLRWLNRVLDAPERTGEASE